MILFALPGVAFPILVTSAFESEDILDEQAILFQDLQSFINPYTIKWNIDEIMVAGPEEYAKGVIKNIISFIPNNNVRVFYQPIAEGE